MRTNTKSMIACGAFAMASLAACADQSGTLVIEQADDQTLSGSYTSDLGELVFESAVRGDHIAVLVTGDGRDLVTFNSERRRIGDIDVPLGAGDLGQVADRLRELAHSDQVALIELAAQLRDGGLDELPTARPLLDVARVLSPETDDDSPFPGRVVVGVPKACFQAWNPPAQLDNLEYYSFDVSFRNCGSTTWTTSGSLPSRVRLVQTAGQHQWGNYFRITHVDYNGQATVDPNHVLTIHVTIQADAYDGPVNQYVSGSRPFRLALDHDKFTEQTPLTSIFINCYQIYCNQ